MAAGSSRCRARADHELALLLDVGRAGRAWADGAPARQGGGGEGRGEKRWRMVVFSGWKFKGPNHINNSRGLLGKSRQSHSYGSHGMPLRSRPAGPKPSRRFPRHPFPIPAPSSPPSSNPRAWLHLRHDPPDGLRAPMSWATDRSRAGPGPHRRRAEEGARDRRIHRLRPRVRASPRPSAAVPTRWACSSSGPAATRSPARPAGTTARPSSRLAAAEEGLYAKSINGDGVLRRREGSRPST